MGFDTVKPRNYYPIYPGSYWDYRIVKSHFTPHYTDTDTTYELVARDTTFTSVTCADKYQLHSYIKTFIPDTVGYGDIPIYSDSVYVSYVEGEPIYGYSYIDIAAMPPVGPDFYKKYPFMSEQVGFQFVEPHDSRFTYIGIHHEIIDKTVDQNGDSLIVEFGHYEQSFEENLPKEIYKYYYKDIGLKLSYIWNTNINDTIYKQELIDYRIGH